MSTDGSSPDDGAGSSGVPAVGEVDTHPAFTIPDRFGDGWPEAESRLVIEAIRGVTAATRANQTGVEPGSGPASPDDAERRLAEAGHRWALAHRSPSLMRHRLDSLGPVLEAQPEPARSDYLTAWRLVTDAATWTSLQRLERDALIDPLTGIGNRRALDMTLSTAVAGAHHLGYGLVVVAIDLDGLKQINDSLGHPAGDRALVTLAGALVDGLRSSDTVFRIGGDEFAVVLSGTHREELDPLMHRVAEGGAPAFTWGAAELSRSCNTPAELLDAADAELYRRRRLARGTIAVTPAAALTAGAAGAAGGVISLRRRGHADQPRLTRRMQLRVAAAVVVALGGAAAAGGLAFSDHTNSATGASRHSASALAPTPSSGSSVPSTTAPTATSPASPATSRPTSTATGGGSASAAGNTTSGPAAITTVSVAPVGTVPAPTSATTPPASPTSPTTPPTTPTTTPAPTTTTPAPTTTTPPTTPATSPVTSLVSGVVSTVGQVVGAVGTVLSQVVGLFSTLLSPGSPTG
jgi:diguanylate cyclase (GGDEF)-like protein